MLRAPLAISMRRILYMSSKYPSSSDLVAVTVVLGGSILCAPKSRTCTQTRAHSHQRHARPQNAQAITFKHQKLIAVLAEPLAACDKPCAMRKSAAVHHAKECPERFGSGIWRAATQLSGVCIACCSIIYYQLIALKTNRNSLLHCRRSI